MNGTLLFLNCCTHCEGFSLAPTCNKAEALGLNSHSSALNVLFDIPDKKKQSITKRKCNKKISDALRITFIS